jgi:hypothetical protein
VIADQINWAVEEKLFFDCAGGKIDNGVIGDVREKFSERGMSDRIECQASDSGEIERENGGWLRFDL